MENKKKKFVRSLLHMTAPLAFVMELSESVTNIFKVDLKAKGIIEI
jgi:hypothetical protein